MRDETILSLLSDRINACRNAGLLPVFKGTTFSPFRHLATEVLVPACCEISAFLNESGIEACLITALDSVLPAVGIRSQPSHYSGA